MNEAGLEAKEKSSEHLKEGLQANGGKLPNILWIVLDHVTFRHYKMTQGAGPVLDTYRRLARDGVEFTNCRSVHPLCLPARSSMMTGMYSHNHGKINNGKHPDTKYPFFADYLRPLGYHTGYFGKNHCGYEKLEEKGFEGFYPSGYGNPYRTEEYGKYLVQKGLAAPVFQQEWGIMTDGRLYENSEYDLTKVDHFNTYSAGCIKTPGQVHEADFVVSMAMDWIKKQTEAAPFILRVDTWGPHHSFQVPLAYKDLINPEEIEEYPSFTDDMKHRPQFVRDFLQGIRERNHLQTWKEWQPLMKRAYEHYSYIDAAVGRLLDLLEERGIEENTIVIYTADHGDALGSHGGMVDKAGDMMEEVMHIPMVIRWPGVTGGEQSGALVSNLDLVPTVLDMAGIAPPEYMDGQSLTSLMKGTAGGREDLMAEHYGHFKVHAAQRVLYFEQYKYIATQGAAPELYDLEKDPFELDNRSEAPEMRAVLREMRRRLLENMDRHGDRGEGASDIRGQLHI